MEVIWHFSDDVRPKSTKVHVGSVSMQCDCKSVCVEEINRVVVDHDQFAHVAKLRPRSPRHTLCMALICHFGDHVRPKSAQVHVGSVSMGPDMKLTLASFLYAEPLKHAPFSNNPKLHSR